MITRTEGYAAAPKPLFEILRGMPPYPAPEGQEWTYRGNREWELSDPPVVKVHVCTSPPFLHHNNW